MKELFDGEYVIQEGYTASIENGKIIVKKEESEDERIRRQTIKVLNYYKDAEKSEDRMPTEIDECIAWLEKQGIDISSFSNEQRKYMEKYISLDKVTLIKLLAERDRNVEETTKSFENLDENTSAWSEGDNKSLDSILNDLRQGVIPDNDDINWLKLLKERHTWKPSDEQIAAFWDAICYLNQEGYRWIDDMKSLYQDLNKLREE